MADYFKITVTPSRTLITTFTGVDIDFAQSYSDVLQYGKMMASSSKDDTKEENSESTEGKYAAFNYQKRIKTRAEKFRAYAFINFVKNTTHFVTLTFDNRIIKNTDNLDVAHECFRKFIKRIQSKFSDFRYLGTFSRQKNGNWHYHILCNFDETVTGKEINDMWKYGLTHSTLITSGDELYTRISYCIDNMYEVSHSDLKGEKGYVHSHGLQDSITLHSWKKNEEDLAYELLHKLLQHSSDKPTPRNSVILKKGETFMARLNSPDGKPIETKSDDQQINYLYSSKGFPELFDSPIVAKRKSKKSDKI